MGEQEWRALLGETLAGTQLAYTVVEASALPERSFCYANLTGPDGRPVEVVIAVDVLLDRPAIRRSILEQLAAGAF